jgi:hypothetical protein
VPQKLGIFFLKRSFFLHLKVGRVVVLSHGEGLRALHIETVPQARQLGQQTIIGRVQFSYLLALCLNHTLLVIYD